MASRRPARWPLAVLTALLVGLPVASWVSSRTGESQPPPIDERVTTYRITYLVENLAAGDAARSTEVATVRRPFDGRVELREGSPPGGDLLSARISAFAQRQHAGAGERDIVLTVEPGPPDSDVRVDANLDAAIERGLLADRAARRRIADRDCHVYRTPELSPRGREEGDFRDLCIDAAGLVLWDELTAGGSVVRRRTATEVDVDPSVDDSALAVTGEALALDDGGGGLRRLTDDSRSDQATVYELPAHPAGFEHLGRYAITPAAPTAEGSTLPGAVRIVGVIDVWTRGSDFVAVFNGGADDGAEPFRRDPRARTLDVGAFTAETVVSLAGAEVRADLGDGRFVRVFGTVPLGRLVGLARDLEPVRGGAITPLDERPDAPPAVPPAAPPAARRAAG